MAEPQITARSRAQGVMHVRHRHTDRFTVVGNHLTQHRELTLTAIGLAVHIQSLPAGARVDIKTLAERFPEGETRIAAALHELEAHGYLTRTRERLPSGRIVTRTVSYDRPGAVRYSAPAEPAPRPRAVPRPRPAQPVQLPSPPAPPTPGPPCAASALLADLGRYDPRLLLSTREVRRLAPVASAWLEGGGSPEDLRRALTHDLPEVPRHPAGLLAYRLAALPVPRPAPVRPPPLQNCDGCDRAFRSPAPGRCAGCRTSRNAVAA